MNMIAAIVQVENDIQRYRNLSREELNELQQAFWTLSQYSIPCSCNKENNPNSIVENQDKYHCGKCNNIGYLPIEGEIDVTPALSVILKEMQEISDKYEKKIHELEEGLKVIRKMNTACESCRGEGRIRLPRPNVYCDREYAVCSACRGTGVDIHKRGCTIDDKSK